MAGLNRNDDMIHNWLLDILRDPDSGEALSYSADAQSLVGPNGVFAVAEGISNFLDGQSVTDDFDYAKHYTEDAEQFDYFREKTDKLTATHLRMLRRSVMQLVPRDASLVLDVGCGRAFVAEHFCPQGRRVVSMDIAYANVHKALERFPYESHAGVIADAYRLPFADEAFDCVVASEIIEHTVDPQGFIASLLRKVKKGGTLLISTPYKEQIAYSLCIHCNRKTPHNAHLHSFDKEKMRHLVEPLPAQIAGMRLVCNKLMLRSYMAVPLAKVGFPLWRFCDGLANALVPKAEHFIIVLKKL